MKIIAKSLSVRCEHMHLVLMKTAVTQALVDGSVSGQLAGNIDSICDECYQRPQNSL